MSNSDVVRSAYESFKRGDIPAILDLLAEDVEWEYGVISTDVPWLQPYTGRDAVRQFFDSLTELEFQQLDPKTFLEAGDLVVALLDIRVTVKKPVMQSSRRTRLTSSTSRMARLPATSRGGHPSDLPSLARPSLNLEV